MSNHTTECHKQYKLLLEALHSPARCKNLNDLKGLIDWATTIQIACNTQKCQRNLSLVLVITELQNSALNKPVQALVDAGTELQGHAYIRLRYAIIHKWSNHGPPQGRVLWYDRALDALAAIRHIASHQ